MIMKVWEEITAMARRVRNGRVPVAVAVVAVGLGALVGLLANVSGPDGESHVARVGTVRYAVQATVLNVDPAPVAEETPAPSPGWPVSMDKCAEDDPCFNPCTMGVDGSYPDTDPRYLIPGPCGLYSPLPYGRRFAIMITPEVAPSGVVCAAEGWGFTRVQVWVREADGTNVSGAAVSESGCADGSEPGAVIAEVTPRLYREAGALA